MNAGLYGTSGVPNTLDGVTVASTIALVPPSRITNTRFVENLRYGLNVLGPVISSLVIEGSYFGLNSLNTNLVGLHFNSSVTGLTITDSTFYGNTDTGLVFTGPVTSSYFTSNNFIGNQLTAISFQSTVTGTPLNLNFPNSVAYTFCSNNFYDNGVLATSTSSAITFYQDVDSIAILGGQINSTGNKPALLFFQNTNYFSTAPDPNTVAFIVVYGVSNVIRAAGTTRSHTNIQLTGVLSYGINGDAFFFDGKVTNGTVNSLSFGSTLTFGESAVTGSAFRFSSLTTGVIFGQITVLDTLHPFVFSDGVNFCQFIGFAIQGGSILNATPSLFNITGGGVGNIWFENQAVGNPGATFIYADSLTGGEIRGNQIESSPTAISVASMTGTVIRGNQILFNANGIRITSSARQVQIFNNTIQSNTGDGIYIVETDLPATSVIGGPLPADQNVITGNGVGIRVPIGGLRIQGNYLAANTLGTAPNIDAGAAGLDSPTAAQTTTGVQNAVVLSSASSFGGFIGVSGSISSFTNAPFELDVYCNTINSGVTQTYLGTRSFRSGLTNPSAFFVSVPQGTCVTGSSFITATVTSGQYSKTSEISNALPLTAGVASSTKSISISATPSATSSVTATPTVSLSNSITPSISTSQVIAISPTRTATPTISNSAVPSPSPSTSPIIPVCGDGVVQGNEKCDYGPIPVLFWHANCCNRRTCQFLPASTICYTRFSKCFTIPRCRSDGVCNGSRQHRVGRRCGRGNLRCNAQAQCTKGGI